MTIYNKVDSNSNYIKVEGKYLSKILVPHREFLCMATLMNPNASWRERTGLVFTLFGYGYNQKEVWDIIIQKSKWIKLSSDITKNEIENIYKYYERHNEIEAESQISLNTSSKSASFSIDDYFKRFLPFIIKKEKIPSTIHEAVIYHLSMGRHPIPRRYDKKPAVYWKQYQERQPTITEIQSWNWSNGIILLGTDKDCFLDVDEKGIPYLMKYKDKMLNGNHWEKTPHGYHIFGRGFLKTKLKRKIVEIRGKGAYIVTCPTEGYTI